MNNNNKGGSTWPDKTVYGRAAAANQGIAYTEPSATIPAAGNASNCRGYMQPVSDTYDIYTGSSGSYGTTDAQGNFNGPPPVMNAEYIAGYLSGIIGHKIMAEFVVGTNSFMDKAGTLREVGVNYFVIEDFISGTRILCDLYSVKFITVL